MCDKKIIVKPVNHRGYLKELFGARGYQESDVTAALKILENDGRAGKRSTYHLAVDETDEEADKAGITPGAVGGDMGGDMGAPEPGAPQAGTGTPAPGPGGAEAPPPLGMKNIKRKNRMGDEGVEDEEIDYDEDEMDMDDAGMEDEMDMDMEGDEAEMDMDMEGGDEDLSSMIDEVGDDLRDLKDLINSIEPRLDDIKAKLQGDSVEELAAMKSLKKAKSRYRRNPYFYGGGNYPTYAQPDRRAGALRRR